MSVVSMRSQHGFTVFPVLFAKKLNNRSPSSLTSSNKSISI